MSDRKIDMEGMNLYDSSSNLQFGRTRTEMLKEKIESIEKEMANLDKYKLELAVYTKIDALREHLESNELNAYQANAIIPHLDKALHELRSR